MEQKDNAKVILDKYLNGTATSAEQRLVEQFYLDTLRGDNFAIDEELLVSRQMIWNRISDATKPPTKRIFWLPYIAAAACLLLVGSYLFVGTGKRGMDIQVGESFAAATNKATITFDNGDQVSLDSKESVLKVGENHMVYGNGTRLQNPDRTELNNKTVSFITASTPRGGIYSFVLSDGTKVWLNAESRLRFPQKFSESENREVQLSGEAYFEVAHDPAHAFIVTTNKQAIKVLGTHFNVNAYTDEESERTVLLQGSVQVNNQATLKPGQESIVKVADRVIVDEADIALAMGWKNGKFIFKDARLDEIMRQISKWYDLDVFYEGKPGDETFNGSIDRKANLSRILNVLKRGGVRFTLKDRTLIVNP